MNAIRQTALLNKRELENAVPPSASWHADYRDTAWLYVGGLPLDLSEGDVVTIFSQFGNPTHLNLIREKETGKSKGFGFLKYEDQRSCDLAVDNLGGADVLGRLLRVDHTRYKMKEGEDEDSHRIDRLEAEANGGGATRGSDTEHDSEDNGGNRKKKRRKMLREEKELKEMLAITQDGEEEDPMREYLINEKKAEVEMAKEREKRHTHKHKHSHRHRHRHRDNDEGSEREERRRHKDSQRDRSRPDYKANESSRSQAADTKRHSSRRVDDEADEERDRPRIRRREPDMPRRKERERYSRSPATSDDDKYRSSSRKQSKGSPFHRHK